MGESVCSWPWGSLTHSALCGMLVLIPYFWKEFWNFDERQNLLIRIPIQQLSEACPKFAININISLLSSHSKKRKKEKENREVVKYQKQIAMDIICPLGLACLHAASINFWSTNVLINSFQGSVLALKREAPAKEKSIDLPLFAGLWVVENTAINAENLVFALQGLIVTRYISYERSALCWVNQWKYSGDVWGWHEIM